MTELLGGIIRKPGSSQINKTGSWRSGLRPSWDGGKCQNCQICVGFCPEDAFIVKNGKVVGIDYNYCKGCGICAKECPRKAIEMVSESN